VSEKSFAWRQAGLVRRAKQAIGTPLISPGPALVVNSLYPGQEKRTINKPEVQSEILAE